MLLLLLFLLHKLATSLEKNCMHTHGERKKNEKLKQTATENSRQKELMHT
jgi:hypothetical protein